MWLAALLTVFSCFSANALEYSGRVVSLAGKVLIRNERDKDSVARQMKVGDSIHEGEIVNTSSNGSAKFLLTDHSIVDVGASTLFKLEEYRLKKTADRTVTLGMDYGTVRTSVNQPVGAEGRYRFKTKTATMGVRGTEFIVQSDSLQAAGARAASATGASTPSSLASSSSTEKTQITVLEGKVEAFSGAAAGLKSASQPVLLTPGTQVTLAAVVNTDAKGNVQSIVPQSLASPVVQKLSVQQMSAVTQTATVQDHTFSQAVTIDDSTGLSKPAQPAAPTKPQNSQTSAQAAQQSQSSSSSQPAAPAPTAVKPADGALGAVGEAIASNVQANPNLQAPPPPPPATAIYGNTNAPPPITQPVNLHVSFTP
jgi:hypothetical protein